MGSIIQATWTAEIEDILRIGDQFEAKKSIQRFQTIPEINAAIDFRCRVDQVPQGAKESPIS